MFKKLQKKLEQIQPTKKKIEKEPKQIFNLDALFNIPKKPKREDAPKYQLPTPNSFQEADLMAVPRDKNYNYLLVVTDIGSRQTDFQPIVTKSATAIVNAFTKIYDRDIIKKPLNMATDPGSEFTNGKVKEYFKNNNIHHRVGRVNRHDDQAIVERRIGMIGELMHKTLTKQDLEQEKITRDWTKFSELIKEVINEAGEVTTKKLKKEKIKNEKSDVHILGGDKEHDVTPLKEGDKVRVALEYPIDAEGSRLHGKWRVGDIRWEVNPSTIEQVIIRPNSPIFYKVSNHKGVFIRERLQPI